MGKHINKQVNCARCGAAMSPEFNNRMYTCEFCGAEQMIAIDEEQLALGFALDMSNIEQFITGLASSLAHAFGDRARVHHHEGAIILLELNIDPHLYAAKREQNGGWIGQYKKLVRGVALKTKTMPLDAWVNELTKGMAAHANDNARVAFILKQLKKDE